MRYICRLSCFLILAAATCLANGAANNSGGIAQIGFRFGHRCLLNAEGSVDCVSESPMLGESLGADGEATFRPVRMVAHGATQLSVGDFAACAIVGGALDCWDKLPATGKPRIEPKRIITSGVTDASVGDDHACAVANGAALCWGSDSDGQSGHSDGNRGNGTPQSTPWPVIAHGVTQVAAGSDRSCAIADGALWCWGRTGLASDPHAESFAGDYPPVRVFAQDVSAVATGSHQVCAVVKVALWCWGENSHGQVGLGYSRDHALHSPNLPKYNAMKRESFVDGDQTCYWQAWKDLVCRVDHPVKVIADGVTAVFARGDETCAMANGALMCWGYNYNGQLGLASNKQDVLKPTVGIPAGAAFVAPSYYRTCAVMRDGTLSCTSPCTKDGDAVRCPEQPGIVTGDPTDISGIEARVGVWQGTIGSSKVMVCLARPYTLNESMYYYLRHRFSIPLVVNDDSGVTWGEASMTKQEPDGSKPAAVWSLQAPIGHHMEGTWSAAGGSPKLPIQLIRVADAGQRLGTGCDAVDGSPSRLAFNAPRVASQKLSISQPKPDDLRQVSAPDVHVSMVELPASMPNAARFNAAMHDWFADKVAGYYECASTSHGGIPDYNQSAEIDLLALPWLVEKDSYSVYCGGAHPSDDVSYVVWNLASGKMVNSWDFIKNSHWDFLKKVQHCDNADDCQRRPPPDLDAILRARFKLDSGDDSNCDGALDSWPDYILHPEKDGLVFSTDFAFVEQACNDEIKLPWKTLKPFLTSQGLDAMRSLQQAH